MPLLYLEWLEKMSNDISKLIDRTIKSFRKTEDTLDFLLEEDAFRFYHMQDCCECVRIYDIIGDLNDLVGCPIVEATEKVSHIWPEELGDYNPESFTWTTYTLRTKDHTVVVRWLGESNGYYGEGVYCHLTHEPVDGFEI